MSGVLRLVTPLTAVALALTSASAWAEDQPLDEFCKALIKTKSPCFGDLPRPYEVICVDYANPRTAWSLAYRVEAPDDDTDDGIRPIARLTNDVETIISTVRISEGMSVSVELDGQGTPSRQMPLERGDAKPALETDKTIAMNTRCMVHRGLVGPKATLKVSGKRTVQPKKPAAPKAQTSTSIVKALGWSVTIETTSPAPVVPSAEKTVDLPAYERTFTVAKTFTTAIRSGLTLIFQDAGRWRSEQVDANTWRARRPGDTAVHSELFLGISYFFTDRVEDERNFAGLLFGLGVVDATELKLNALNSIYTGVEWVLAKDFSVGAAFNIRRQDVVTARKNQALTSATLPTEQRWVPGFAVLLNLPILPEVKF